MLALLQAADAARTVQLINPAAARADSVASDDDDAAKAQRAKRAKLDELAAQLRQINPPHQKWRSGVSCVWLNNRNSPRLGIELTPQVVTFWV